MQHTTRIGILFGGRSGEHEVSLMSARSVLSVLDPARYTVTPYAITLRGSWLRGEPALRLLDAPLGWQPADTLSMAEALAHLAQEEVIFPVLHGTYGEDGTLQGMLEIAGLPFVGAGVLGSALGMDKAVFKDVLRANAIPTPASRLVLRAQIETDLAGAIAAAESVAPYPLFTKPANLGSSVGVMKCRSRADLIEGLQDAARYDRRVLVEQGINAREIEVSVLGNQDPRASVVGEIIPGDDFYTFDAKYYNEASQLLIPAPIPEGTARLAQELAVRAFVAADCAGMARADFLLDRDTGAIFLSEINTIPGFTRISMYPKLWEASGLPYPALVDQLIELALQRKAEQDRNEHEYGRSR